MKVVIKRRPVLALCFVVAQFIVFVIGRWSVTIPPPDLAFMPAPLEDQEELAAPKKSTYLVIAIMTGPDDAALRETIRSTWLSLTRKGPEHFRHVFPIGSGRIDSDTLEVLEKEQTDHGDLLFLPEVVESYEKLARKTAHAVKAIVDQFEFLYLLKVDGDSFVRINAMLKTLRDFGSPRLYLGFLDGRAKPQRIGKWKEIDWMLCDRYLPYQLGGGYVIAAALAKHVAANIGQLRYFVNEDVSMGVWIAGIEVKYVHDPRFDTEFRSRGCNNEYLVTHKKTPEQLKALYANMKQTGKLCFQEFQSRGSYVYDFSVLPSECCTRRNNSGIP